MKKYDFSMLFLAFLLLFVKTGESQVVTVEGHAFLEFQEYYDDIKVKFERIAPSYFTDSTYTDYSGFYNADLEAGIYTVLYSKSGFIDVQLPGMPIYQDTVLIDQTLETIGLIGELTGQILAGTYEVGGDIFVPANESLEIQPGTVLKFKEDAKFEVFGELMATGTSDDSIIFTHIAEGINWKGIDFKENSSELSLLKYCVIEYSNDRGISVFKCSPSITHSLIRNNSHNTNADGQLEPFGGGAGICLKYSNSVVKNVIVRDNTGITPGCGIYCSDGNPLISNSLIINNTNPQTYNEPRPGGGICCSYDVDLQIENTVICFNKNTFGGGIYLNAYSESFSPNVTVTNSIIYENSVEGEYSLGGGIGSFNEAVLVVLNSLLWNNEGGNLYCSDPWLGVNVTVNNNMDSCDAYGNLQMDPLFVAPVYDDFSLGYESPCIDAGENSFVTSETDFANNYRIWDGNSDNDFIVDMGTFEFGSPIFPLGIASNNDEPLTNNYIHPNPAENVLNIDLQDIVRVDIFDYSGKIVLSSTEKSINISFLNNGLYLVKIQDKNPGIKTVKLIKL